MTIISLDIIRGRQRLSPSNVVDGTDGTDDIDDISMVSPDHLTDPLNKKR
jgi:hypothetical protein